MKWEITIDKLKYIQKFLLCIMLVMSILITAQVIFNPVLLSQYNLWLIFTLFSCFLIYITLDIIGNNCSLYKSINPLLHSFLIAAVVIFLIGITYGSFLFSNKYLKSTLNDSSTEIIQQENPTSSESEIAISNEIKNETLLGIIAILLSFTGLLAVVLSYAFHRLIRGEIYDELKTMAQDERIASRIEIHIGTSNIFSKLYRIPLIKGVSKKNKMYLAFEKMKFLKKANKIDLIAKYLTKELKNKDDFKEILLRAKNNQAYNIYLKYLRWEELKDDKIKIEELKKEDDDPTVSTEEIWIALEARDELLEIIANGDACLFHDYDGSQKKAWIDTCEEIGKLIAIPNSRWENEYEKLHK